jgi:hypothetical protein
MEKMNLLQNRKMKANQLALLLLKQRRCPCPLNLATAVEILKRSCRKVKKVRKRELIILIPRLAMIPELPMDHVENLVMSMACQGHKFHQVMAWKQWTFVKVYLVTGLVYLGMLGMSMTVKKLLIVEAVGINGKGLLIISSEAQILMVKGMMEATATGTLYMAMKGIIRRNLSPIRLSMLKIHGHRNHVGHSSVYISS